jgi:5,10-methylenetetrahydromethanopterin reductase
MRKIGNSFFSSLLVYGNPAAARPGVGVIGRARRQSARHRPGRPRVAMLLRRGADQALAGFPNTTPIPPALAEIVAGYVDLARNFRPQGAHYLENHHGHLMFVKPEERPFVTAELIRLTSITATEREIKDRIAALFAAGYDEIAIQIIPGQEHAIEDWGRIRRAFA